MHLLRILAAIAAIASGVWVGNADWSGGIPFDAVLSLIGTFGGYMAFEWADRDVNDRIASSQTKVAPLSQHDLRLGRRLRDAFPLVVQRLLREHSFGQVFHSSAIEPLEELQHEWRGGDYEIDDDDLRALAEAVTAANTTFLVKLGASIEIADNYPATSYSVPTRQERAHDLFDDRTHSTIAEIDDLATKLLQASEAFKKAFRLREEASAEPAATV